jgi:DNA repair protein RecN (Recombination protein N)
VVHKSAVGTVTTSDTSVVAGDLRVVEIARMLGGDADREVSRAHARELLDRGGEELGPITMMDDSAATPKSTRGAQRRGKPV